ncbi:MAG: hypothetical protein RL385_11 [Pseudomonadota bacterium]|jgi:hypothetical protein
MRSRSGWKLGTALSLVAACIDDSSPPCPPRTSFEGNQCSQPIEEIQEESTEGASSNSPAEDLESETEEARKDEAETLEVATASPDTGQVPSDSDPSGTIDAAQDGAAANLPNDAGPEPRCYIDADEDGFGSAEIPCPRDVQDSGPTKFIASVDGDCDDKNRLCRPTATESCDGVDNDCDSQVDEEFENACGGSCQIALTHEPGSPCSNNLLGACARSGTYECDGNTTVKCNAPTAAPTTESCDGVDNDCDGQVDEADAQSAPLWYVDCDGDGYAAGTANAAPSCGRPAPLNGCAWTSKAPDAANHVDWDCDDHSTNYHPGADYGIPPAGGSWDFDCSGGVATPAPSIEQSVVQVAQSLNVTNPQKDKVDAFTCNSLPGNNAGDLEDTYYVWLDSFNNWRAVPPTTCPDSKAFQVTRKRNAAGYSCSSPYSARYVTSVWPCK